MQGAASKSLVRKRETTIVIPSVARNLLSVRPQSRFLSLRLRNDRRGARRSVGNVPRQLPGPDPEVHFLANQLPELLVADFEDLARGEEVLGNLRRIDDVAHYRHKARHHRLRQ